MVYKRFEVLTVRFHHLELVDNITHKKYGKFDRFDRTQLEYLCNDLNIENQHGLEYEDNVRNTVLSAIANERTTLGRNVLMQLADALGIDTDDTSER